MKVKVPRSLLSVFLLLPVAAGCSKSDDVTDPHAGKRVMIDSESLEAFIVDSESQVPAANPVTGKLTLKPALYCPNCNQWHEVPPMEQLTRMPEAGKCQTTGAILTIDGPWPEDAPIESQSDSRGVTD